MSEYTNLISVADLRNLAPKCVILDCRAKLGDPNWGHENYLAGHIPGAFHANLDRDLATPPNKHGRHPLPPRDQWLAQVQNWGIQNDQQVVVYDDAGGAYAARAWWMFRWLGHTQVAVLDGGLPEWQKTRKEEKGSDPIQVRGDEVPAGRSRFVSKPPLTRIISTQEILASLDSPNGPTLVDARAKARWSGSEEPIDAVAGHIPGALCYPFQDNLAADGLFKSPQELRMRFNANGADLVCYCGSGVTAAHNILAMHIAGLPEPALYADSWSGWITDPTRPIAATQ